MGYVTNKKKSIKREYFRWIFAYSYFAFDNVFKNK